MPFVNGGEKEGREEQASEEKNEIINNMKKQL